MSGYQDISSAPKDGRLVVLFDDVLGLEYVMRWLPGAYGGDGGTWCAADGSFVWGEDNPDEAPSWWRSIPPMDYEP